jgi:hypothetical protein
MLIDEFGCLRARMRPRTDQRRRDRMMRGFDMIDLLARR